MTREREREREREESRFMLSFAVGESYGGTLANTETGWRSHPDWRMLLQYETLEHYIMAEKVFYPDVIS